MAVHKYPPGPQELLKKTGFCTPPVPLHCLSGIESVITPSEGVRKTSDIPTPSEGVNGHEMGKTSSQSLTSPGGNSTPSEGVENIRKTKTPSEGVEFSRVHAGGRKTVLVKVAIK